jgi:hypothetical protein
VGRLRDFGCEAVNLCQDGKPYRKGNCHEARTAVQRLSLPQQRKPAMNVMWDSTCKIVTIASVDYMLKTHNSLFEMFAKCLQSKNKEAK